MRLLLLSAAAAASMASPADAHWQFTRWGMTIDQVAAASPQKVLVRDFPDLDTPDSRTRAGVPYRSSQLAFTAAFGFDSLGRLNRVTLYLSDLSRCGDLRRSLDQIYGPPAQRLDLPGSFSSATWSDLQDGNAVTFSRNYGARGTATCMAIYRPLDIGL